MRAEFSLLRISADFPTGECKSWIQVASRLLCQRRVILRRPLFTRVAFALIELDRYLQAHPAGGVCDRFFVVEGDPHFHDVAIGRSERVAVTQAGSPDHSPDLLDASSHAAALLVGVIVREVGELA